MWATTRLQCSAVLYSDFELELRRELRHAASSAQLPACACANSASACASCHPLSCAVYRVSDQATNLVYALKHLKLSQDSDAGASQVVLPAREAPLCGRAGLQLADMVMAACTETPGIEWIAGSPMCHIL